MCVCVRYIFTHTESSCPSIRGLLDSFRRVNLAQAYIALDQIWPFLFRLDRPDFPNRENKPGPGRPADH